MIANDNERLEPAILPHMPAALRLLAAGRVRLGISRPVTMAEATETAFSLASIVWGAAQGKSA